MKISISKNKLGFFIFGMLFLLMSFMLWKRNMPDDLKVVTMSALRVIDMENPAEVVGHSHNVFVGYVEELENTHYRAQIPYTRYYIKVLENIKGNLTINSEVYVNKEGGISEDGSFYVLYENDFLPSVGQTYIFCVRQRVEDGSYTASGQNSVILMDDIHIQKRSNGFATYQSEDLKEQIANSEVYKQYLNAYENQILYDPNRNES